MTSEPKRTVFISAAETSGDAHAARLIGALSREQPAIRCIGLGGPAMAQAGCNLLENLVDRSTMLAHSIGQVHFYLALLARLKQQFRRARPDLVVLVDSPAWNFHVARLARNYLVPVLYYIAPQLWAWGSWRIGKLRRRVDRLACILPFEQEWFRERGIDATYVGHPLFDEQTTTPEDYALGAGNGRFPTVALLPGSRRQELQHHWQPMQQIAASILQHYRDARFLTAARAEHTDWLRRNSRPHLGIEVRSTSIATVVRHADLALVTSGTATLEVAARACPMIIMYHVPLLQWHLVGRWLVRTRHLSLVNILARRELVPEFMPFHRDTTAVAETALALLADEPRREQLRRDLRALLEPMAQPGASDHVARIVREMLGIERPAPAPPGTTPA